MKKKRIKTWWSKYHNHVYGVAGLVGLAIAIITIFPFSGRAPDSKKNAISDKKESNLVIKISPKKISIKDQDSFSFNALIIGFASDGLPIDDISLKIYSKANTDNGYSNDKEKLENIGITNYIIDDIPALGIDNPNYERIIQGAVKKPGHYWIKAVISSEKYKLTSSDEIELEVKPLIFYVGKNYIVDTNPYGLFGLNNYTVCVPISENLEISDISQYVFNVSPNYIGALGGFHLFLKSNLGDEDYLSDKYNAILSCGNNLWEVMILNDHQLSIKKINWVGRSNRLYKFEMPYGPNIEKKIFIKKYSKEVIYFGGHGATGRNFGFDVKVDDMFFGDSIPLAENFRKYHNDFTLFEFIEELENKRGKIYLVYYVNWEKYLFEIWEFIIRE